MGRLLLFFSPFDRAATVTIVRTLEAAGVSVHPVRAGTTRWQTIAAPSAAVFIISPLALRDPLLRQQMRAARQRGLRCIAVAVAPLDHAIHAVPFIDASVDLQAGSAELIGMLGASKARVVRNRSWLWVVAALIALFIILPISIGMALGDRAANEATLPTLHPFSDLPTPLVSVEETAVVEASSSLMPTAPIVITVTSTPSLTSTLAATATETPSVTATVTNTWTALPSATATDTSTRTPRTTRSTTPTLTTTATRAVDELEARFTADLTTGSAPLVVVFENNSHGEISAYAWDFNSDDQPDSTYARPFPFTYEQPGLYTVTLTVYGEDGESASETLEITVTGSTNPLSPTLPSGSSTTAIEPAQALFYADSTSGDYPLTVVFTDDSWGTIASYAWDFDGDGQVDSTAPEPPPFTYTRAGTFTALLRVTGADGRVDEERVAIEVFAPAPPVTRPQRIIRTLPPTATVTTAAPTLTFTSTATATLMPTATFSLTPTHTFTLAATATLIPTATPTLTATPTFTLTPTSTFTPTATVTLTPTVVSPQPLPLTASFDNGATDWLATGSWMLTTEAAANGIGSGWRATAGASSSTLLWSTPIDLRTALVPQVSFQSYQSAANASAAQVQITSSGGTQSYPIPPSAAGWSTIELDLSAFRGQIISLSFVWIPAANTNDVWLIDSLVVQETPATLIPSATQTPTETPTFTPTFTNTPEPSATELITVPVETTAEATMSVNP
ncbi:MAG: PKD domain-containing protein [Anaerolineae bacterium]|nr:PKD domain-containing protein [Anaerolineae bacterium]